MGQSWQAWSKGVWYSDQAVLLSWQLRAFFWETLASALTTDLPEALMLSMAPSLIHGDLPFLEV